MPERKIKIPFPGTGEMVDATDVPIDESNERWSEIKLADGVTLRMKSVISQVARIDGRYDSDGNPVYLVQAAPIMTIASIPDSLKKKVN